ncbi:MAG: hypothetical protein MZV64_72000 [Ignavibacteriales bacterium]|nr:hypothetical protein [Ignavibacteriales bacterium]
MLNRNAPTTKDTPTSGEESAEFAPLYASKCGNNNYKDDQILCIQALRKCHSTFSNMPCNNLHFFISGILFSYIQLERQKVYIKASTPNSGMI